MEKFINKKDLLAQMPVPSIKNIQIPAGSKVIPTEVVEGSYKRNKIDVAITKVLCLVDGGFVSIPVAELARMKDKDGKLLMDTSLDQVPYPDSFTVVSSTDRVNAMTKQKVYPAFEYVGYAAYMAIEGERDMTHYNALIASGLKDRDNAKAVQDYVVTL